MHQDGRTPDGTVENTTTDDVRELRSQVERLTLENTRLARLLEMTPREVAAPGPVQGGWFEAAPGPVQGDSTAESKVALFGALFAARTDL